MPLIHLKTRRLEYKFEIFNKYNIIEGDSGTGKTALYELINSFQVNKDIGINDSSHQLVAMPIQFSSFKLNNYTNCIIVIDEDCDILSNKNIPDILKKSNNYFIIITRKKKLGFIPVDIENIYEIKSSGKFHTLKQKYSRFSDNQKISDIDLIITEDSRSGNLFIKEVLKDIRLKLPLNKFVITSHGAPKLVQFITNLLINSRSIRNIVVVYDSAAYGEYYETFLNMLNVFKNRVNFYIIDWYSFESYIIQSSVYGVTINREDVDYKYESIEQYATKMIEDIHRDTSPYSKSALSKCLKQIRCKDCIESICDRRNHKFNELVYWRIRTIYNILSNKNKVNKAITYMQYKNQNDINKRNITSQTLLRIEDIQGDKALLSNNRTVNIEDIIINTFKNGLAISNPSKLTNWSKFKH